MAASTIAKLVLSVTVTDGTGTEETKAVGWGLNGLEAVMIGITLKDLLGPAKDIS